MIILLFLLVSLVLLCGRYRISKNSLVNETSKTMFHFYAIVILFFLTCFRYNVGYDYKNYYGHIIAPRSWGAQFFEFIPQQILLLARYFHEPLIFFVLTNGTILILFLKEIYDESISPFESLIVFLSMFYLGTLSTVRQYLAVAIVFYGFRYVKERAFLKYLICVVLATLCHNSAVITITIYFIYNYFSVSFSLFCVCIGFVIGPKVMTIFFGIPIISAYQNYIDSGFKAGGAKSQYLWYLIFFFSLVIFSLSSHKKSFGKLFSITSIGVVFPRLFGATMGGRMAIYFYVFYILLVPCLFTELKPVYFRKFYLVPFYLYYVLFLLTDADHDKGYTNYVLYFFKEN